MAGTDGVIHGVVIPVLGPMVQVRVSTLPSEMPDASESDARLGELIRRPDTTTPYPVSPVLRAVIAQHVYGMCSDDTPVSGGGAARARSGAAGGKGAGGDADAGAEEGEEKEGASCPSVPPLSISQFISVGYYPTIFVRHDGKAAGLPENLRATWLYRQARVHGPVLVLNDKLVGPVDVTDTEIDGLSRLQFVEVTPTAHLAPDRFRGGQVEHRMREVDNRVELLEDFVRREFINRAMDPETSADRPGPLMQCAAPSCAQQRVCSFCSKCNVVPCELRRDAARCDATWPSRAAHPSQPGAIACGSVLL